MVIFIVIGAILFVLLFVLLLWWYIHYRSQVDPVKCTALIQSSGNVTAGNDVTVIVTLFGRSGNTLNGNRLTTNARAFSLKIYVDKQDCGGPLTHIETVPLYLTYTENNVCYFRWVPKTPYKDTVYAIVCYNNSWIGGDRLADLHAPSPRTPLVQNDILDAFLPDRDETSRLTEIVITPSTLKTIVYDDDTVLHNDVVCRPNEACQVIIKGFDQFRNIAPVDTQQWYLEGQDQYGSLVDIQLLTKATPTLELLQFVYSFKECGVYYLTVKNSIGNRDVIVPDPFTIWVTKDGDGDFDGIQVVPYAQAEHMEWAYPHNIIKVCGYTPAKLQGEGCGHLENINRVLDCDKRLTPNDVKLNAAANNPNPFVYVNVSSFDEQQRLLIHKLLSLLIKSMHYRKLAFKLEKRRIKWKERATAAYNRGNHTASKEAKVMKEACSETIDELHLLASRSFFSFFNFNRTVKEIDLHGQLVADEKKLYDYQGTLLEKHRESKVEDIIQKERYKKDEAIRYLKTRNVSQVQHGRDWLEIIVGAGHHSKDNRPKIKPKVEQFLIDNNVDYQQCNKGSLLITYKEYNGTQPCFGSFYCKVCENSWESSISWKGCWQKCFKCESQGVSSCCYPMKLSSMPTSRRRQANNKQHISNFTSHQKLCQRCLETGRNCRFALV